MTKLENEKVRPVKPLFYRRFVDDVINRRKKNEPDLLFQSINDYHTKLRFTLEVKPEKFLDTKIVSNGGMISTLVYRKENKLTSHWSSQVPKKYKRNAINGDLSRAFKISSDFAFEVGKIKAKFEKAGYPTRFVDSVANDFMKKKENKSRTYDVEDEEYIIPPNFFELPKPSLMIELPYCEANEKCSKSFLKKFHQFTQDSFSIFIKWKTRKVRSLFRLKDKNPYPSCVIYEGTCKGCNESYIGETVRNAETRWSEHGKPTNESEPSKHIKENIDHEFDWKIMMSAPKNTRKRKTLEAFIIALKGPSLNEQIDSKNLTLFRNGVT